MDCIKFLERENNNQPERYYIEDSRVALWINNSIDSTEDMNCSSCEMRSNEEQITNIPNEPTVQKVKCMNTPEECASICRVQPELPEDSCSIKAPEECCKVRSEVPEESYPIMTMQEQIINLNPEVNAALFSANFPTPILPITTTFSCKDDTVILVGDVFAEMLNFLREDLDVLLEKLSFLIHIFEKRLLKNSAPIYCITNHCTPFLKSTLIKKLERKHCKLKVITPNVMHVVFPCYCTSSALVKILSKNTKEECFIITWYCHVVQIYTEEELFLFSNIEQWSTKKWISSFCFLDSMVQHLAPFYINILIKVVSKFIPEVRPAVGELTYPIRPTICSWLVRVLFWHIALLFISVLSLSRLVLQLTLLLLLSGDVETNPGPTNTESVAEYADLITLPNIDSKWMEFGTRLSIKKSLLNGIKIKHGGNLNRCKREMLRLAVHDGVTWERILRGLMAIGFSKEELVNVCNTMDVEPLNGLSDILGSRHHEEPDLPSSSSDGKKQDIPVSFSSDEHGTFRSFQSALLSIFQSESLLLANAMYSNGIISQEDLHKFRVISSNEAKATVLLSLIEGTLLESPFKFQSFITALHSVSSASSLSDKISHAYRFNQVKQKMIKTSDTELDLNHLSAELNNKKLLSDSAHLKASRAGNLVNMCSILLTELQDICIGNAFIDLLESFENTKVLAKRLQESLNIVEADGMATIKQTKAKKSPPVSDAPLFASSNVVADSAVALSKSNISKSKSSMDPDKPLFTSIRVEADSAVALGKSSVSKSKSSVDPDKPLFTSNRVEADSSRPLQSIKSKAKAPPLDTDKPLFSSKRVVADSSIQLGIAKSDQPVSNVPSTLNVDQPLFTSKRVVSDSSVPVGVAKEDKPIMSMPLSLKGGESKPDKTASKSKGLPSLNIDEPLFKSNRVVADSSVSLRPAKQEKPVSDIQPVKASKSPLPSLNIDQPLFKSNRVVADSSVSLGPDKQEKPFISMQLPNALTLSKSPLHSLNIDEPSFKSNSGLHSGKSDQLQGNDRPPLRMNEPLLKSSRVVADGDDIESISSDSGSARATEHLSEPSRSIGMMASILPEPYIVIDSKQQDSAPSSNNKAESSKVKVQSCIISDGSDDETGVIIKKETKLNEEDLGMSSFTKRSSPEASNTEDSDAFMTASSHVSLESTSYERSSIETDLHVAEDSIVTVKSISHLNVFEDTSASQDSLVLANDTSSQLKEAVLKDNAMQVEKMLSERIALIDQPLKDGCTALMLAAKEDCEGVVSVLLRHKASVSLTDHHRRSALYHAVQNGNYEIVMTLVREQTVDLNCRNDDGVPLLVEAASRGFSMIAETLLENGANPDLATPAGVTPIYAACSNSHRDTVQMLLKYHADVNKVCRKTRKTPLEVAIEGQDPEIVKSLMEAIATANKMSMELFVCVSAEDVKILFSKGAKVDTRNHDDATPLIIHCDLEHIEVAKELVRLRANVDLQNKDGYSALMMSAKRGNVELVQILVKAGAILDFKEKQTGYTALMFGIVCDNARIVKELVLARANTAIRNKDGHSCLELARERQCPQVMDALELQPSNQPSNGGDSFTELLSEYMREKKTLPAVPSDEGAKSKLPSSPKKKPQQHTSSSTPTSSAESDGILIADIRKKERRIADLETRIHDLTAMQGYKPLDDETNVSYMERGRLEIEYKKLKEAKKKAEQYSIEAKQTAQRLSAENFKLREDLSKEKHLNELRHKNMVKEIEQQYKRRGSFGNMEVARKKVFKQEVMATAAEILKNDPTRGLVFERVTFTEDDVRDIMTNSRVRIGFFHILIAGLPGSGKTSMIKSMVNKDILNDNRLLNLYEVILNRNILGAHEWVEAPKIESEINHILFAFAYFFVRHHQLPKFDKTAASYKIYDDPEVQKHFESTFNDLQKLLLRFDGEKDIQLLLSQSLNLINVYDAGVNKAVFEFLMATGRKNKNFFLVNVIDMSVCDKKSLTKPMDLEMCSEKSNELQFYKSHTALHHFAALPLVASSTDLKSNVLIVGTHKDNFSGDNQEEMIEERKKMLMNLFDEEAAKCGVRAESYNSEMIAIDARNPEHCQMVKDALIRSIDSNKNKVEIDLPVSFVFLRCVLYITKQIFISRKELLSYAKKCLIKSEDIEEFLTIFRNTGSIMSSDNPDDFLYEYVVLLPCDFLRDLNKLYDVGNNSSIPKDIKERAKYGFISDQLLKSLWQGVSGSLSLSDVYSKILQNVYLMVDIGRGEYFMPSLRYEYCDKPPHADSLIITTNYSFIPFNRQCDFIMYFLREFKEFVTISDTPHFNKTILEWKEPDHREEMKITIKIHHNFFEISVISLSEYPNDVKYFCSVISRVKKACFEVMKSITEYMPDFRFDFAVMCPESADHFATFKGSVNKLRCKKCASVIPEQDSRMIWVSTTTERNQLLSEDILKPSNLLNVIKDELSSLTTPDIRNLAEKLSLKDTVKSAAGKDVKDLLFDMLYKWHDRNPSLTKQDLIEVLEKCGLYQEAAKLGSTTLVNTRAEDENETTLNSKQLRLVASCWPQSYLELANILKINTSELGESFTTASDEETKCSEILSKWQEQEDGDRSGKLAAIMEEKDYINTAEVILNFL